MLRTACAVFALGLILALPGWLAAVEAAPDAAPIIYRVGEEPQPEPSPVRWDNHIATLGAVRLDAATKTVIASGCVKPLHGAIKDLTEISPRSIRRPLGNEIKYLPNLL